MKRCRWADPNFELYIAYHDREWGRLEHDDQKLFEMLILEGFQAGLSWLTILKKREAFRRAFDRFDPAAVAQYGPEKVESLMADAGSSATAARFWPRSRMQRRFSQFRKSLAPLTDTYGALPKVRSL